MGYGDFGSHCGQADMEALDAVWEQTRGQPWLVSALAREMCSEHEEPRLREPRVRRVIEPLLSGGDAKYTPRDFEYVRDLGHVAPDAPLRIANPVYAEVLSRELTWVLEHEMSQQTA